MNSVRRRAADVACVVIAAVVAFPLYWMVLSALKPAGEIQAADPRPWTLAPTVDSFRRVLDVEDFGLYFLNSLVVAVLVVALSLVASFLAAVALTRFRFRGRGCATRESNTPDQRVRSVRRGRAGPPGAGSRTARSAPTTRARSS